MKVCLIGLFSLALTSFLGAASPTPSPNQSVISLKIDLRDGWSSHGSRDMIFFDQATNEIFNLIVKLPPGCEKIKVTYFRVTSKPAPSAPPATKPAINSNPIWDDGNNDGPIAFPSSDTWTFDTTLESPTSNLLATSFMVRLGAAMLNILAGDNVFLVEALDVTGNPISAKLDIVVPAARGIKAGPGGVRAKPVIYLYPTTETTVAIKVTPKDGLSATIPKMGNGWRVRANPQGQLTNLEDGRTYSYLFWEGPDHGPLVQASVGFCVAKSDLGDFFKSHLSLMGLNASEIGDFLKYWLPLLAGSNYQLIWFVPQSDLDRDAPLSIQPKPDTVIRVYFEHLELDQARQIPAQNLVSRQRQGFTVVEWGGRR